MLKVPDFDKVPLRTDPFQTVYVTQSLLILSSTESVAFMCSAVETKQLKDNQLELNGLNS